MMTQSIPIQVSGILNQAVGSANTVKRSGRNEFDLFLDGSIKRETKIPVRVKTFDTKAKGVNASDKRQSSDGNKGIMGVTQDSKAISSDNRSINNKSAQNLPKDEQDSIDLINLDVYGQILTMLDQIKNAIMEELELTSEELDTMMTDLGLELSDLTNPQAIMQIVLADNGTTEPFAMLMDEQLGDSLQSLLTTVNDIKDQANLKLSDEEIKLILEQSMVSEDNKAMIGDDETKILQPIMGTKQSKDDSVEDKDKLIRLQAETEDGDINSQRPVITAKADQEFEGKQDGKGKSERTDGFEAFLDKLGAQYDKPVVEFTNNSVNLYDIREIAQQIIDQIRVSISPEQTTMELQLNPEHLGKVNLTVSSKEGVLTAHFVVQNDLAKEAVEGQLITLKDTLAQQGIKVETIEVTVASYTFDQRSPSDEAEQHMQKKQKTGHKITFEEAIAMSEEPLEEADSILTGSAGYTIDYTA